MGIFSRLWPRVRKKASGETPQTEALIQRLLVLSPQLRFARAYRERLAPVLATSLEFVGGVVRELPSAHEASASNWLADPYIHAFFATPDDVPHTLSRSLALHAWFDRHPLARETYGVLGMAMTERQVPGVEQRGDAVHTDVMHTTLSFNDHQVRVCDQTEDDLREQIVRRVVEQIALEGLAQIGADESRRDALELERALLRTRLQLLTRQGAGTGEMLGHHRTDANVAEVARIQAEIDQNERELAALGLKTDAIEHQLDVICGVLAEPQANTHVVMKRVRLSPVNVVVEENGAENDSTIEFPVARIPANPEGVRAFSLVRFARADLLPLPNFVDEGARFVI